MGSGPSLAPASIVSALANSAPTTLVSASSVSYDGAVSITGSITLKSIESTAPYFLYGNCLFLLLPIEL